MLGDPRSGSKVWEALDREIAKPGENSGQIVAHWELQPAAAFQDRENRRNLRSRLWTTDVYPVLPAQSDLALPQPQLKPQPQDFLRFPHGLSPSRHPVLLDCWSF